MSTRARRRFTLLDAMALVAATAAVLGLVRGSDFSDFYAWLFSHVREAWTQSPSARLASGQIGRLVPLLLWPPQLFLSAWTMTLFVLRLVPPRPRRRRLASQPGTVACGAVSLVLAIEFGLSLVLQLALKEADPLASETIRNTASEITGGNAFRHLIPLAAWAAAASWLVLAAGGRWRPEPDWVDRTGRIIGATWISMVPLYVWVIVIRA